jgi:4-diphosphocytidyl-2-C-methyl-D-erythritol kinase
MDKLYIKAMGKINLSLDVVGKRPDGYHDLKMIMQTVELHDDIYISKADNGISVMCEHSLVPEGESNLAYKAAKALCEYTGQSLGVQISISKNIPVAAGMAGGSSDAAAVLKGMNQLFSLGLDINVLKEIGNKLGADVPYCLCGGTMLAEGTGNILTPLTEFSDVNLVLIKPKIEVSTAWVFKNYNNADVITRPDTDLLINALEHGNLRAVGENMANVLESVTIKTYPVIEEIKNDLLAYGALGSLMSGSGPTVFGVFDDFNNAQKAYLKMSENCQLDCYLTKTIC